MSSNKRIALFLPSLAGGGAQRMILNLAGGFAARDFATDLVLTKSQGPYLSNIPPDVRVLDLQAPRMLKSLPALVRYLRAEQPIALLSTLTYANVLAIWAKKLANVPTRVVVREATTLSEETSRNAVLFKDKIMPLIVRHTYPRADGIVAVSEGVARDLAQITRVPLSSIHVLANPVVTPELSSLASEPLNHAWFSLLDSPVVLGAGRLSKEKDFPTLIRAFAKVRKRRRARLMILGEGGERPRLEALVKELGLQEDVSLPGFVQNPFAYMARSALFVLSSTWEGLPGVLIQALACGTPVVSTDCESGPRQILQNGRFGRLVPVADISALATAIMESLEKPRPAVPQAAWKCFGQDAAVEQYLRVLQ